MRIVKRFTAGLFGALFAVFLAGCGGGGGESSSVTTKIRLFADNFAAGEVRITDDVLSSPTTPIKLLSGGATQLTSYSGLDLLAIDTARNLLYRANNNSPSVLVWENAATVEGNQAPTRVITLAGVNYSSSLSVDSSRNVGYAVVYTGTAWRLAVVNNISTRSGSVTPDALIDISITDRAYSFADAQNNRLYIVQLVFPIDTVRVYNNISSASGAALAPSRTVTFTGLNIRDVSVDASRDRIYLSDRNGKVLAFTNASTLSGTFADPVAASVAWWNSSEATMGTYIDPMDRIWWWGDSNTSIRMYTNASTLSGNVTKPADKIISDVVKNSYGIAFWAY